MSENELKDIEERAESEDTSHAMFRKAISTLIAEVRRLKYFEELFNDRDSIRGPDR